MDCVGVGVVFYCGVGWGWGGWLGWVGMWVRGLKTDGRGRLAGKRLTSSVEHGAGGRRS